MSLDFIAIVPHAPELLPSAPDELKLKTDITRQALGALQADLRKVKPDLVVVVEPPRPENHILDSLAFAGSDQLAGDLVAFGDTNSALVFKNRLDIVKTLRTNAKSLGIGSHLQHEVTISPHSFISLTLVGCCDPTKKLPNLIIVENSEKDFDTHWLTGEMLGKTLAALPEKVALLASSDLTHRVEAASADYLQQAAEFDNIVITALRENNSAILRKMDAHWAKEVGEEGLRALLTVWAAAQTIQPANPPSILSYEAPFKTGYLTVNLSPR